VSAASRRGSRVIALALVFAASAARAGSLTVHAVDGDGALVDLTRQHASISRTPPDRLPDDPFAVTHDPDALRFVVVGAAPDLPRSLAIVSLGAAGEAVDALTDVPLLAAPCSGSAPRAIACASTPPVRAVMDELDRSHPLVAARSIRAELGGTLVLLGPDRAPLGSVRVGGPRVTPLGPIERLRARLRVRLVRVAPGGRSPMGDDDAAAIAIARAEVGRANALWAQCGVSFGPLSELDVAIVDPPGPHLLALGSGRGLPATGGAVHLRVDGKDLTVALDPAMTPVSAARRVAQALRRGGWEARVSDNPVIAAGALGSADVLVRRADGSLARLEPPSKGALSTDPTMGVRIGEVDLSDGLQHFVDIDAVAGTIEERALIKALDDGDPSTIEVIMVPGFAGGGRIGESFISADGGSIRNVVLGDRAGVRADRMSFALAHELGHVLLDDPGHPDDFGADTPTRLMDADAANGSAFGPRRLSVDECVRAVRQSGPSAPVPLLTPWPLGR
jgi:hypothetical protein